LQSVRNRGHRTPTPIQSLAIPPALAGRDLIAIAGTGSGKTVAFLLPIINRFHRVLPDKIAALILAPTRELASQIGQEFARLARNTGLRAAVIVGGESMSRQTSEIRTGVHVLIACPGRLIDHLERGTVRLDRVEVVIIDEADRMLDMGFLPQLRRVLRTVGKSRQTLMFSATMDSKVEPATREFLTNPAKVRSGALARTPATCRQTMCRVTLENKAPALLHMLGNNEINSAIVFTRTKSRADRVTRLLVRNQFKAIAIHGGRSQAQRSAALAGFRAGRYAVLVATDVAARGLDIPDVSHVINFDLPDSPDSYLHRIGRTARMGKSGDALSLVTSEDESSLRGIERDLGVSLTHVRLAAETGAKPGTISMPLALKHSPAPDRSGRPGLHSRETRRIAG
jgi:ATP-dependent RNA helicase RhlE